MTTLVLAGSDVVIDKDQHKEALAILDKTRDCSNLKFSVDLENGEQLEIASGFSQIIERMIQVAAKGGKMTFSTLPDELTTVSAASMLGISRPTLMKLIQEGQLPSHKVGTHTRLKTSDVSEFHSARIEKQKQALNNLRSLTTGLADQ